MSEIQHTDEVVTKDYLANFYQGILPYLGGSIPTFANMFNRSDILETTEKVIGGYLGKPLYQKVVAIPSTAITAKTIGLIELLTDTTIDDLFVVGGFINTSAVSVNLLSFCYSPGTTDQWWARPYYLRNNHTLGLNIWLPSTQTITGTVIINYTKSTDAAGSFHGASANDYSTSETIVGTWIDGKPIYQRTVAMTAPNVTTDGTAAKTILDISSWNLKENISLKETGHSTNSYLGHGGYFASDGHYQLKVYVYHNTSLDQMQLTVSSQSKNYNGIIIYVTVQYTKTTD